MKLTSSTVLEMVRQGEPGRGITVIQFASDFILIVGHEWTDGNHLGFNHSWRRAYLDAGVRAPHSP